MNLMLLNHKLWMMNYTKQLQGAFQGKVLAAIFAFIEYEFQSMQIVK